MEQNSFNLLQRDAEEALRIGHLQEALACLQGLLTAVGDVELSNECNSIQRDYEMMLNFMQQGGIDPQRQTIFLHLLNRSSSLLDMAARSYRLQHGKDLYAEIRKHLTNAGADFAATVRKAYVLQEQQDDDSRQALCDVCDELFEHLWTAPLLRPDDTAQWQTLLEQLGENARAMLLGAVMLSTLNYFDPHKFRLLLHFCRTDNIYVRARALTAAVLVCMRHEHRLQRYPDLCEGFELLAAEPDLRNELVLLQKQLLLTLETDKAKRKLQDEILPDMLKNRRYQRNKMGFEELEEELAKALRGEPNAEWEQVRENKALADNMKEIIEMGKEGIDINIGTFAALKNFPFFRHIGHWFMPFDEHHPEIKDILPAEVRSNPVKMIMDAGNFCDSDKYSLCLMLRQIMPKQREMMMTQMGAQMDGQEDEAQESARRGRTVRAVYRNYLQNLYRFYKLYPQRAQFDDPLLTDLLYTRHCLPGALLKSADYLTDMASFLIKRECYQDAADYIGEVLRDGTATAELLQKLAFCYQRLGQSGKAVYHYQQADLLLPDNEWILRQMRVCYSALGKYEQELDCLRRLEAMHPDDHRLASESGLCLMQLERYEEAAQRFYELEYKQVRVLSSWRAIAWCNFKMNKLEQAGKYYQKLLGHEKAKWEDHLNAGHTAWCMHRIPEAVEHYRTSVRLYCRTGEQNARNPLGPFDADRDELLAHGIGEPDITLMRDIIMHAPGA